jgi:hypothetical protein
MKSYIKLAIAGIVSIALAAIPATLFYLLWSWSVFNADFAE